LVGDVSGKGLQAALTMTLIVGFWQKLVFESDSPGEILRQLTSKRASRTASSPAYVRALNPTGA
jgi:hypothetical protein